MIVLDTSAAIELLLALPLSPEVQRQLDRAQWQVAAPQLLVVEVLQVLRRRVAAGITTQESAEEAQQLMGELNAHYFDHQLLADRIWQLRGNLTAYDGCFIALAEMLEVELLTADTRMAKAPGHEARVTLLAA